MDFNCVQRCQGNMIAVAIECGPNGEPEDWEETWEPPRQQQPRTSHLRADAGPCIIE
jgi:hypothetical protein